MITTETRISVVRNLVSLWHFFSLRRIEHFHCSFWITRTCDFERSHHPVEFSPSGVRQLNFQGAGVFIEVLRVARAGYWHDVFTLAQNPGESNLCRGRMIRRCD